MAVTLNAKSTAVTDSGTTATTFTQANLTIAAGATGLVYQVAFSANVTGVTAHWDSTGTNQLMTLAGSFYFSSAAIAVFMFVLQNPTVGLKTFSISWTTAAQASVYGTSWNGSTSFGNFNHNTGTTGTNTVTITSASGDMMVGIHANDGANYTATNGTNLYEDSGPSAYTAAGNYLAGPTAALTGTFSGTEDWVSAGLAVQAGSGDVLHPQIWM